MLTNYDTIRDLPLPAPRPVADPSEPLQKYGQMRKDYLASHHSGIYSSMEMSGALDRHCLILQHQAEEYLEELTARMMREEAVRDEYIAADPTAWDRRRFDIQEMAEQAVLAQLICTF